MPFIIVVALKGMNFKILTFLRGFYCANCPTAKAQYVVHMLIKAQLLDILKKKEEKKKL